MVLSPTTSRHRGLDHVAEVSILLVRVKSLELYVFIIVSVFREKLVMSA